MSKTHRIPDPGLLGTLIWLFNIIGLVLEWLMQGIRPVVFGGVPRRSFFHSGSIDFRNLSLVQQLVADGKLKGVVDSVWDMEDAVKVSSDPTYEFHVPQPALYVTWRSFSDDTYTN